MTLVNLQKDFAYNRILDNGNSYDGDKAILESIRRHRYVFHNYIIYRLKSIIEMKLLNFFWANTWEHGRIWTENEITYEFLSQKIGHDKSKIKKYMKQLLETEFLKRTPCGNKSYKYSLDFESEYVKFIVTLEENFKKFEEDIDVEELEPDQVFGGQKDPKDPEVWGPKGPQKDDSIYIVPYSRSLKESNRESPLFEKWKKNGEKYEEVTAYVTNFIKIYNLDWQCGSFISKQDDMLNVHESLKIAHEKLSNGFRAKKTVSAYICGLIKKRAGRERLNKSENISRIKEVEKKHKLKVHWTKRYVQIQKGNDNVDIYFSWETKAVRDILENIINYGLSEGGKL